jgi:hypothetical protein
MKVADNIKAFNPKNVYKISPADQLTFDLYVLPNTYAHGRY